MSIILAIETSQHIGSVAVRDRAGIVQSETLSPKKRHDDDLLPAIDRLFERCGFKPRDLSGGGGDGAVAVSIGPGGFTGLRIAVATAKMFAETLSTRIIAVPSALVAAGGCSDHKSEVRGQRSGIEAAPISQLLIALACKNDTFWSTRLERRADHWIIAGEPGIADARTMSLINISAMVADEHLPADARGRCAREGVPIIEPVFEARTCLVVAERMLTQGNVTDPLHLLPLYPRQPEAVTIWERRGK